jgi:hypothetical protein
MFARLATSILLISCALASAGAPSSSPQDKSCREHPRLVGKCFNVHARLATYNGNPAVRLWRIGTKRVLGVSNQRFKEPGYSNIPNELLRQLDGESKIIGDFLVCPFTRSKPGEMQLVCIESAKNTVVKEGP